MKNLRGKVALISGDNSGIGYAVITLALSQALNI